MCFAFPGKVIEINGKEIVVDYIKEKRKVKSFFSVKKGDYVIVSNKIVIKIVPEKEALESLKLLHNEK